jgi:hypothetical protein
MGSGLLSLGYSNYALLVDPFLPVRHLKAHISYTNLSACQSCCCLNHYFSSWYSISIPTINFRIISYPVHHISQDLSFAFAYGSLDLVAFLLFKS